MNYAYSLIFLAIASTMVSMQMAWSLLILASLMAVWAHFFRITYTVDAGGFIIQGFKSREKACECLLGLGFTKRIGEWTFESPYTGVRGRIYTVQGRIK